MKIVSFNSETGVTLIEVMIALIIIAIIILGGGMFFFYGRVNIIREAHRRAAVLVASQRLEELKAADYNKISPSLYDEYYIISDADNSYIIGNKTEENWIIWNETVKVWDPTTAPVTGAQEPVDVDNLLKTFTPYPTMVTEAQWEPEGSQDYLKVTVTVNWHDSTDNSVSLTTLIAPHK